jgi:hypothetical protein
MPLRRIAAAVVIGLAGAACAPDIPQTSSPSKVVTAVFDPVSGKIPLPNDLVLKQLAADPHALDGKQSAAQIELLQAFNAAGGFPNDQELPVTIDFTTTTINADGTTANAPADLDLATFTPETLVAFVATSATQMGAVALDPIQAGDYANGRLTLHNKGRQPWAPGQYIIGIRGGAYGVKTTVAAGADPVYASQVFFLIAQGQQLETEQNIGLLAAQTGSRASALPLAQALDLVISSYAGAYSLVNRRFPQRELAVMATFAIAPTVTQVQLDPGRGLVPLPIDLLRDPRPPSQSCPSCGKLTPLAACTLAGGKLDSSGTCSSAGAAGFAALDGFSTTGAILAPTSDLVQAKTVTAQTLQLYDLGNPAAPALVSPTSLIVEPCEFSSSCSDAFTLSTVIALQPSGATANDSSSVFRTRPLKDNTSYAVVISDGILDKAGKALGRGTVGRILLLQNALVDANGASQLAGIDNNTAGALELMRQSLKPALTAAATNGIASTHVAMAYTFKTESFLSTAVQLGALPYTKAPATGAPGPVTPAPGSATARAAQIKYGVPANIPRSNISEVLETTITTFNLLSPSTGAFDPTSTTANETVNVLIATPLPIGGPVQACTGPLAALGAAGLSCAPMVVFRHGLGRGRGDMLLLADTLAAQGMVTVAIDAAKHNDRSFCTPGIDTVTVGGATLPVCADAAPCKAVLPAGAQGDKVPPGICTAGYYHVGTFPSCSAPGSCGGFDPTVAGLALVSANYLISGNLFRTRDTLRQDIIDQSQLIRAIAYSPSGAPPTGHTVFDRMAASGVIIDPTRIYYVGQSLGSIQGAADVASNPRISKAVFNVGGATFIDLATTSPAFAAQTNALLAALGISPGTSAYLQFLTVAKTVLDPFEPANFAGHLQTNTLPNLLTPLGGNPNGSVPQAPKAVLTQAAFCDQVVPNPWNFIFDATAGTTPILPNVGPTTPGTFQIFVKFQGGPPDLTSCPSPTSGIPPPGISVSHGFLLDFANANITRAAQSDAAAFLAAGTLPNSLRLIP